MADCHDCKAFRERVEKDCEAIEKTLRPIKDIDLEPWLETIQVAQESGCISCLQFLNKQGKGLIHWIKSNYRAYYPLLQS